MTALPPILGPELHEVLLQSTLGIDAIRTMGSPLRILIPSVLLRNVEEFRSVFRRVNVKGTVFYACKVNKSDALLDAAALAPCGVEVSSMEELRAALSAGFDGKRILVSGPMKSARLMRLAAHHDCCVVIDDLSEIQTLFQICRRIRRRVRILFRMSGFVLTRIGRNEPSDPHIEQGRFGVPLGNFEHLLALMNSESARLSFDVLGLSFHLDNHSLVDRRAAIRRLLPLLFELEKIGYSARVINIGGGFSVRYVDPSHWKSFHNDYCSSLCSSERKFMFRDKSFGIVFENGGPVNRGNFYPYETEIHGPAFLEELLVAPSSPDEPDLNVFLGENGIELWVEPGKSLVDQAGAILAYVRGMRRGSGTDFQIAVLDMNISHLYEQFIGSEFASDPVLLTDTKQDLIADGPAGIPCHLAGNLCLESDILAWRPVTFRRTLTPGDVLAFANTAGYQMDFAEANIHRMPSAARVAAVLGETGWEWMPDDRYCAIDDPSAMRLIGSLHEFI